MDDNKKQTQETDETEDSAKPKPRRTRKPRAVKKPAESEKTKSVKEEPIVPSEVTKEVQKTTILESSIKLLEKTGLKRVSNKTFINEVDLEAFLQKDFTNINKTKAFGFIQILEREYPVDLSELKAAYIAYYHEHQPKQNGNLFVHAPETDDKAWKKYFIWALILLLMAIVSWYIFGTEDSIQSNISTNIEPVSVQEHTNPVIEEAKKNLIKLEENKSHVVRIPMDENDITTVSDSNSEMVDNDLDLDAMVKEMIQENNISVPQELTVEDTIETNTIKKIKSEIAVAESETISLQPNAKPVEKKIAPKKLILNKIETHKKPIQKVEYVNQSKLYIQPSKKAWIGVIYLDTYQKKDFLVKNKFKLDPNRAQLIVIGHKYFEIFNNGYSFRFRGRGPVRFIYKDGNIMEINQKEFLEYSKGVNW